MKRYLFTLLFLCWCLPVPTHAETLLDTDGSFLIARAAKMRSQSVSSVSERKVKGKHGSKRVSCVSGCDNQRGCDTSTGTCSRCVEGRLFNDTTKKCGKCPDNATCDGTNTYVCNTGYTPKNGGCVPCNDIYIANGTCTECSGTEYKCTNNVCNTGYSPKDVGCNKYDTIKVDNGKCTGCSTTEYKCTSSTCDSGYSPKDGSCKACKNVTTNCSSCSGTEYKCTGCGTGYSLKDGSCKACKDIHGNCTSCSGTEYKCTACSGAYAAKDGTCKACSSLHSVSNGTCTACSASSCTTKSCNNGYALKDGSCKSCSSLHTVSNGKCTACDASSCTKKTCDSGYKLKDGKCVLECDEKFPRAGSVCTSCTESSCTNYKCQDGYAERSRRTVNELWGNITVWEAGCYPIGTCKYYGSDYTCMKVNQWGSGEDLQCKTDSSYSSQTCLKTDNSCAKISVSNGLCTSCKDGKCTGVQCNVGFKASGTSCVEVSSCSAYHYTKYSNGSTSTKGMYYKDGTLSLSHASCSNGWQNQWVGQIGESSPCFACICSGTISDGKCNWKNW